jgi:hypothetical protein
VLDKLVLDPQGNGNSVWEYEVHLKVASEPVGVICVCKMHDYLLKIRAHCDGVGLGT